MEFVLSQLKSEVVWGGKDRPRKGEDFSKRMRAVVNGKKHYMKQQTPTYMPLAEKKRLGHGDAQVSRLLLNRIISANDGAASLLFDDLELLLTYLDAEESEKEKLVEPLQDANGFFNNRPELWKNMEEMKRLSPVELLYSFSRHFAAELPGLMFDWLAYEDRLWELAGKLKKAFDVAGLKLGKNKTQYAFESAKFTLVEIVDSTLLALRKKIRGSATQEEVARVREAAQVLSRFIVRHGDDGLKGMEEEQKRATQARLDKLPELHLKEFGTRIKEVWNGIKCIGTAYLKGQGEERYRKRQCYESKYHLRK
jgi:hypothetical protein